MPDDIYLFLDLLLLPPSVSEASAALDALFLLIIDYVTKAGFIMCSFQLLYVLTPLWLDFKGAPHVRNVVLYGFSGLKLDHL